MTRHFLVVVQNLVLKVNTSFVLVMVSIIIPITNRNSQLFFSRPSPKAGRELQAVLNTIMKQEEQEQQYSQHSLYCCKN